ncbi:hypothetical protein FACS189430_02350 [Bacteroidia bacterium]|nr:hypothetical protein FACS189430_02350 [Bacteroidia bacterium]
MKIKLVLKEFSVRVKHEAWYITIVSAAFCVLFLYEMLTGIISPQSGLAIGGFIFFACGLLIGIWQLLQKKTKRVVTLNGWKYKLFLRGNKFRFIVFAGISRMAASSLGLVVFWFYFYPGEKSNEAILGFVGCGLIAYIIFVMITGYWEYKKFSSLENVDDKTYVFPKDK